MMDRPAGTQIYERSDGHSFAYRLLGPKPREGGPTPLVMITGLSAVGLVDWAPLDEDLAKERPVLVFDNRLIGWSTATKEAANKPYTMSDMARDTSDLVVHALSSPSRVAICGFSMVRRPSDAGLTLQGRHDRWRAALLARSAVRDHARVHDRDVSVRPH